MKKNLALGLSTVLAAAALSACGTANSAPQASTPAASQTATATATADASAQDRAACVDAAGTIGAFLASGRTPSTVAATWGGVELKKAAAKAGSAPIAEAIRNSAQWMDFYLAAETSFAEPNLLLGTVTTCDKAGYIRGDKVLAMRAK